MMLEFDSASFTLAADRTLSVWDAQGSRVRVVGGCVWVTQEGDPRDLILEAGDTFTLDRSGRTVLSAFERDALVLLERPQASARPVTVAPAPLREACATS